MVFDCKRCGNCCDSFQMFDFVSRDEWKRIVTFVGENYGGHLCVSQFDPILQRYTSRMHIPRDVDIEPWSGCDYFNPLGGKGLIHFPCPFFYFDFQEGIYTCRIQDIKPEVCNTYLCRAENAFGSDPEYCRRCWCESGDVKPTRPCEVGDGCRDFFHRVQFFIAFARKHPSSPGIKERAEYFSSLVEKNKYKFRGEMERDNFRIDSIELNLSFLDDFAVALSSIK
ncbi:MAG: hypothetical protein ACTSUE_17530 [Promethearchaeota archaeon]